MRDFAARLRASGHRSTTWPSTTDNLQSLPANLDALIARYQADTSNGRRPTNGGSTSNCARANGAGHYHRHGRYREHFYSARDEAASIFGQRGSWVMGISIAICASATRHGQRDRQAGRRPAGTSTFDNREAWPGMPWGPPTRVPATITAHCGPPSKMRRAQLRPAAGRRLRGR
jgi:deoxyribodipyrimidine photolyase-related protein